jgi:V8-like Glu-specific endopeptidase
MRSTSKLIQISLISVLAIAGLDGCHKKSSPQGGAANVEGDQGGSEDEGGQSQPNPTSQITNAASRISDQFQLSCGMQKDCNASVGILFGAPSSGSYRCMFFVVGEKDGKSIVATNKHCVEQIQDCREELYFRFPANSTTKEESAGCSQVLKQSPDPIRIDVDGRSQINQKPDYAFVQLDRKVSRPALQISQSGLGFSAPITLYYADQSDYSSNTFEFKRMDCTTTTAKSILSRHFTSSKSQLIGLYDCEVKAGNSGSPVLDSTSGKVAGIVQDGIEEGTDKSSTFSRDYNSPSFKFERSSTAANLACIEFEPLKMSKANGNGECKNPESDVNSDRVAVSGNDMKTQVLRLIRPTIEALVELSAQNTIFAWKLGNVADMKKVLRNSQGIGMELVPSCFYRPNGKISTLSQYKQTKFRFWESWTSAATLKYPSAPIAYLDISLNAQGEIASKVSSVNKEVFFDFNPEEIAKLGPNESATVNERLKGQMDIYNSYSIGLCTEEMESQIPQYLEMLKAALAKPGDDAVIAVVTGK